MTTQASFPRPLPLPQIRLDRERAALEAALQSQIFQARPRLASLLQYICERYFEGESEAIKEYSIATEVFRRPESFDQATDSIVRVEVFRLRKKLREFYEGEGVDQPIEIVIATGHYRPMFVERATRTPQFSFAAVDSAGDPPEIRLGPAIVEPHAVAESEVLSEKEQAILPNSVAGAGRFPRGRGLFFIGGLAATLVLVFCIYWRSEGRLWPHNVPAVAPPAREAAAVALTGPEIRIRCGYSRPIFKDNDGNIWTGDRYFSGGFASELPRQQIARTRNQELYLTARTGVFSYTIPLAPGTYELHLYFAETTYGPISTLGGGENSRVFDVRLNGRPLLTQFDIVSDAGPNTADMRVFRDVSPDRNGQLRLDFNGSLGLPTINAIEIVPGLPHRLRPIRMVAQDSFFIDKSGNLWMPDSFFSSGRLAADKVAVAGTPEPGLFAGERYGNFSYALPVDDGAYKITLFFSEKYWGASAAPNQAEGKRVFDIYCNGIALTRGLDIAQEAGPGRALIKVFHGLRPDAQGKLILSFVPVVNYASVNAVEVEQERP